MNDLSIEDSYVDDKNGIQEHDKFTVAWKDVMIRTVQKRETLVASIQGNAKSGRITAIMGPSGCGKSTLFNFLGGFISPEVYETDGNIYIDGNEIPQNEISRLISYKCQFTPILENLTVRESLEQIAFLYSKDRTAAKESVEYLLHSLGLIGVENSHIGTLSAGEKERKDIAANFLEPGKILLFDEPLSGLDSYQAKVTIDLLKESAVNEGKCVMFTVHQPSDEAVSIIDDLYLMVEGKVVYSGPIADVRAYFEQINVPLEEGNLGEALLKQLSIKETNGIKNKEDIKRINILLQSWHDKMDYFPENSTTSSVIKYNPTRYNAFRNCTCYLALSFYRNLKKLFTTGLTPVLLVFLVLFYNGLFLYQNVILYGKAAEKNTDLGGIHALRGKMPINIALGVIYIGLFACLMASDGIALSIGSYLFFATSTTNNDIFENNLPLITLISMVFNLILSLACLAPASASYYVTKMIDPSTIKIFQAMKFFIRKRTFTNLEVLFAAILVLAPLRIVTYFVFEFPTIITLTPPTQIVGNPLIIALQVALSVIIDIPNFVSASMFSHCIVTPMFSTSGIKIGLFKLKEMCLNTGLRIIPYAIVWAATVPISHMKHPITTFCAGIFQFPVYQYIACVVDAGIPGLLRYASALIAINILVIFKFVYMMKKYANE